MAQTITIETKDFIKDYASNHFSETEVDDKKDQAISDVMEKIKHSTRKWADKMADDELSDEQLEALDKAAEYQLLYLLCGGDFSQASGYDPNTHTRVDMSDLDFSRKAERKLQEFGFLYRGLCI